jgi:hypothetical protein
MDTLSQKEVRKVPSKNQKLSPSSIFFPISSTDANVRRKADLINRKANAAINPGAVRDAEKVDKEKLK